MNTTKPTKRKITADHLIWGIYLLLLGVLLPHTAWAFAKFEPDTFWGVLTAWAAALAFEAAIAVLTHRLALHLEATSKKGRGKPWGEQFKLRYVNEYGGGLVIAWVVSTLANLAHSVEYGGASIQASGPMLIFGDNGWRFALYAIAFGAILPTTSLLFARILSNVVEEYEVEKEANPEFEEAKQAIQELKAKLRTTEDRAKTAELQAKEAEDRFQAAGDIFVRLMAERKRDRVLAAMERWPQLPASAVAIITETSPSYVSEVKNSNEANDKD